MKKSLNLNTRVDPNEELFETEYAARMALKT